VLQPDAKPERRPSLDTPGNALILAGLTGLIVSLSLAQDSGWAAPIVLGGAGGGVVLLCLFVLREIRARDPLLDLRILRSRSLSLAMASAFANAMAQWSPVLLMVLYFQAISGDSPLIAGLKVTPLAVSSAVAAVSTGRLTKRVRPDDLAVAGSIIAFLGLAALAVALTHGYPMMFAALVLIGVGTGIFGPSNANIVMLRAPRISTGVINGARLMLANTGWVVSTAVVLTLVTAPVAPGLRAQFFAGTASRVSHAIALALLSGYGHAIILLAAFALAGSLAALASRSLG
jgi:MFS family permease